MGKLKEVGSVEEILSYAKEQGISLTEEQAKEIFARVSGALSDDDLKEVAGGADRGWEPSFPEDRFLKQPR